MASISTLLICLFLLALQASNVRAEIGVCYGSNGDNLPPAQDVVNLYKDNGIGKMRIYWPDPNALNALRGSNIELILDVPKEDLAALASDPSAASVWVQNNVQNYSPDVNFKYIAVGNEITPGSSEAQFIRPAMESLQNAISGAGLGDQIKVSTATFMALLDVTYPPSQGSFSGDAKPFMKPVLDFLVQNNAPLLVNIYPYFSYTDKQSGIDLDYALFRSSGIVVQDGPAGYQNLFDAMLDACYSALEKEGTGGVEIVVSESGWPSDGNPPDSSLDNAGTFYGNLINHVNSGSGTPKRPGKNIETYLFAMFDENQKQGAETEKHFGLFTPTQEPKYQISFN